MAENQDEFEMIWVRGTAQPEKDGGVRIGISEAHEAHPDGEVFVAGPKPVYVARTPLVNQHISLGLLEPISESVARTALRKLEEEDRERRAAATGEAPPARPLTGAAKAAAERKAAREAEHEAERQAETDSALNAEREGDGEPS